MTIEVRDVVLETVEHLKRQQLQGGDIPCFRTTNDASCSPCTLLSTLMHDSLGCFDPVDRRHEPGLFELFSAGEKQWLTQVVSAMRWRIRNFVVWQEERDATWQLYGRESSSGADANTTACAAIVVGNPGNRSAAIRLVRSVERFLERDLNLLEKANILRFLSLAGRNVLSHVEQFRDEILASTNEAQDPIERLVLLAEAHGIARAWRQAGLPYLNEVAEHLVARILAWRNGFGPSDGHLACALAASALDDLGYDAAELREWAAKLISAVQDPASWLTEPYANLPVGSPAAGIGIALAALSRISVRTGRFVC
jgi:hypothetical protein